MQKITPFLWFDNNAEEAMHFYTSVFKESKVYGGGTYKADAQKPAGSFLVGTFELFGQRFMVLNGGPQFKFNESVSFVINCEGQEEVDYYWDALTADGGSPGRCGWLKDKYGLSWQVTPAAMPKIFQGSDPEGAKRAFQAMMQMTKIDIAKLEEAYHQQ
jgi:predicted 3-demethylubiquinone-9 3-methyltransferase (glyoxalase superfamily)